MRGPTVGCDPVSSVEPCSYSTSCWLTARPKVCVWHLNPTPVCVGWTCRTLMFCSQSTDTTTLRIMLKKEERQSCRTPNQRPLFRTVFQRLWAPNRWMFLWNLGKISSRVCWNRIRSQGLNRTRTLVQPCNNKNILICNTKTRTFLAATRRETAARDGL